jgi:anti-anti-sigma regulatory factor
MHRIDTGASITIDVRRALVYRSIIRIQGGLLNTATASVWRTVETELRRSPELVALDLSEVTDIDAAGVGVLVAAAACAGESDISFCLVGAYEGAVGTALAEADLTELFEILPAGAAAEVYPLHITSNGDSSAV